MFPKNLFIRNLDAERLQEGFLITSVTTVIVTRFFLFITQYPQIGDSRLHIAHILWGGFFMLIGILIFMAFLNKSAATLAVFISGVGFGLFIDELGKFVTRDSNYFFKPTVALIYVIFIFIYLFLRALPKYKSVTKNEYLLNAIEMVKEAVLNDLDIEEKKQAREYLKRSDQDDPVVSLLSKLLGELDVISNTAPSILTKIRQNIRSFYLRLARSHLVGKVIVAIQALQTVVTFFLLLFLLPRRHLLTFDEIGNLITSLAAAIFVLIGLMHLKSSRARAYHYFRLGMLINIFLTQFFVFYRSQFSAVFGLFLNISILIVINYVLALDEKRMHPHRVD